VQSEEKKESDAHYDYKKGYEQDVATDFDGDGTTGVSNGKM